MFSSKFELNDSKNENFEKKNKNKYLNNNSHKMKNLNKKFPQNDHIKMPLIPNSSNSHTNTTNNLPRCDFHKKCI